MYGYEVVAGQLRAIGVETGFGLLGSSNLATVGVLARQGMRFIASRHESGAVCLAAGYAWATGRPALCTVTHGPGLANALTALTSAARDRVPIVLLVGDVRNQPPWQAQRADHEAMVGWTGCGFLDCSQPARLAATVTAGFAAAAEQRRPVVLNVPAELLGAPAVAQRADGPGPARQPAEPAAAALDQPALRRVADALASAQRPVILGGRGAMWSGAGPALRDLGAACGALLSTTLPALGLFDGDPYDLGVCGGYATAATRRLLHESDCVLAVGTSLNGYATAGGTALGEARVIHLDTDPSVFGRNTRAELTLAGDAATLSRALAAELAARPGRHPGYRTADVAAQIGSARRGAGYPDLSDDTGVDPRAALRALDRLLPADRQVVIDLGHFSAFPIQALSVARPGRFFPAFGFGSVGLAVATAAGAAAGRPVPTVVVVGDGGALMSLGELETLARHRLPVMVVVLNDHAYGAEIHHLRSYGLPPTLADHPPRDLAAVAASLGLTTGAAATVDELDRVVRSLPPGVPTLVDVRVTRATVADRFAALPNRASASST